MDREYDRTEWSLLKHTDSGMSFLYSTSSCSLTFISHHQGCDYPPFLPHGYHERVNGFSVFKKEEVIYKCHQGYTLVGEPRLSCSYSRWSPAVPQCKGNSSSLFSQVVEVSQKHRNIWFDLIWFIWNHYYVQIVNSYNPSLLSCLFFLDSHIA